MRRLKRYFVLTPGSVYAGNFYGHTEAEARRAAREWGGWSRLPRGTAVWLDTDTDTNQ